FPTPRHAQRTLAALGSRLEGRRREERAGGRALEVFGEESRGDLESYAVALQALCLGPDQLVARKATYVELAHALARHLTHAPELTGFKLVGSYLRNLAEDLRDCGDEQLAALGQELNRELTVARAARVAPAMERRPDLPAGSTASVAEQFAARYSRIEQAPPPEDDPAPPGDLTAERVFRLLLEACIRDGRFTREETEVLVGVRELLGISLARHSALHSQVQRAYEAGEVEAGGDLSPPEFFERCCRVALEDHALTAAERELLQGLGRFLHITADEFAAIKRSLAL
ncbi:MAG: hypothetical protein KC933_22800, partial [Myxococcales bacterium]|nr:hypothetical protein [Myxococcales bacterium]